MGFTSDEMNATPCNHFLDNIHLWDIPYVMNAYISLKTGDNQIYEVVKDSQSLKPLKPYFPFQIVKNYNKGSDAYKNYEDVEKAKKNITFSSNTGSYLTTSDGSINSFHNPILFQAMSIDANQKKQLLNTTNYYDNYIASKIRKYFDFVCNSNLNLFNIDEKIDKIIPETNDELAFKTVINMVYRWSCFVQDELFYMAKVIEINNQKNIITIKSIDISGAAAGPIDQELKEILNKLYE